jgi:hypothetical protein
MAGPPAAASSSLLLPESMADVKPILFPRGLEDRCPPSGQSAGHSQNAPSRRTAQVKRSRPVTLQDADLVHAKAARNGAGEKSTSATIRDSSRRKTGKSYPVSAIGSNLLFPLSLRN